MCAKSCKLHCRVGLLECIKFEIKVVMKSLLKAKKAKTKVHTHCA